MAMGLFMLWWAFLLESIKFAHIMKMFFDYLRNENYIDQQLGTEN